MIGFNSTGVSLMYAFISFRAESVTAFHSNFLSPRLYLRSDFATCPLYNQFYKTNMTCLLKLMTWIPEKYNMGNFI